MASWVFIGFLVVAFYGLIAYSGQDSAAAGLLMAGIGVMLMLGALALWQHAAARHPVPAAEYLAVVWLIAYVALGVMDSIAGERLPATDWLILLPPLSFVPPLLRRLLGDDGDPRGPARTAAYYAHQTLGVLYCGLGLLFMLTVLLIIAAPLPLVPGIMHLRAGHLYHVRRKPRSSDPRRGFMD